MMKGALLIVVAWMCFTFVTLGRIVTQQLLQHNRTRSGYGASAQSPHAQCIPYGSLGYVHHDGLLSVCH